MGDTGNLSPDGQRILAALRATARAVLERKHRLGQFAVIWQDDRPVLVGGDADAERVRLLADKAFLEGMLAQLPESDSISRASAMVRLQYIETFLDQLPPSEGA